MKYTEIENYARKIIELRDLQKDKTKQERKEIRDNYLETGEFKEGGEINNENTEYMKKGKKSSKKYPNGGATPTLQEQQDFMN